MNNLLTDSVPWLVGGCIALTTAIAQIAPTQDWSVWVSTGMAGVVMVLLLKFFPMLLKHMDDMNNRYSRSIEATNERHEATIRHIVEQNQRKDEAWQAIFNSRGYCPVNPQNNPHENNETKH